MLHALMRTSKVSIVANGNANNNNSNSSSSSKPHPMQQQRSKYSCIPTQRQQQPQQQQRHQRTNEQGDKNRRTHSNRIEKAKTNGSASHSKNRKIREAQKKSYTRLCDATNSKNNKCHQWKRHKNEQQQLLQLEATSRGEGGRESAKECGRQDVSEEEESK
ncbi:uncharacterized protein DDB_G0285917-like [Anastrepha ludens]|uniref:uncharacterized protein DDB_G0285917-like n=1 Tax=Anastrepha ludens TaxID=28586 RepID=UPI0023B1DFE4|nr:uncharacterized protein DDB_G0285917-like [Anastrepha ludens]